MNWNFDKLPEPDGIPDFLKRDANNRAPFMAQPCTLCAAVESPGFYTGCMVKDGHAPGATCVNGMVTPAKGPQEKAQAWLPPLGSTS